MHRNKLPTVTGNYKVITKNMYNKIKNYGSVTRLSRLNGIAHILFLFTLKNIAITILSNFPQKIQYFANNYTLFIELSAPQKNILYLPMVQIPNA